VRWAVPRRFIIVASALRVAREILYTEDLEYGQPIEQALRLINPFLD
jgi:predicted nucleic acid-binding protein